MLGRVIEILDNGRVHVSVGREQMRDIIVMYPANMRLDIQTGQRMWVFEPEGSSTERYGLPVALHKDDFAAGPGELVALQSQIEDIGANLKTHVHTVSGVMPGAATLPTGTPLTAPPPAGQPLPDPPPGAQKVRAE